MNKLRVGWIGTGVMGSSMAGHLLSAGYPVTVYTRTKAKAQDLLNAGAGWADNPKALAEQSDVVFSIVGYPNDVEAVLLGDNGALLGLAPGGILCDMTTSSPALAERIAKEAKDKGCEALDCPVTGGDIGAKEARLTIFVGGSSSALETVRPLLSCMGKIILPCGGPGLGQKAKLANQVAIAGVMFATCESLLFAQKAGLNVSQWLESVIPGAAGSVAMNTLGRRVLAGNTDPGFFINHFVKDLGLCLEECKRMNLVLPGLAASDMVYRMLKAQGYGSRGTQFLTEGLALLSGTKWTPVQ
ncbi:MAG: NAD(P)-dependent oxidoreductase [Desulfovibrionaceae bacterium]|nr:NAD(P)-dependent oxidoreductase [Desulfovibrionaceae bacterium]